MLYGDWDIEALGEETPVHKVGHEVILVIGGVLDGNNQRIPETELTFVGTRPEVLGFLLNYDTELFKIRLRPGTAIRVWDKDRGQRVYYRPEAGAWFMDEVGFG